MSKQVLITGATGYLGRHLLTQFNAQGAPASALVRNAAAWPQAWRPDVGEVAVIEGSPTEASWLGAASKLGVDTIVHTAGIVHHSRHGAEEMMDFNVESAAQMVRTANKLGARVILVSSSGTVGCFRHFDMTADEHAPFVPETIGTWPYYVSKMRAEQRAIALADKLGVPLSIVRLPVLLGPNDHRLRSTGHVTRALTGRVPFVPPGGMHFSDVRDVAAAIMRASRLPTLRAAYHLPGHTMTLGDFFQTVAAVSGVPVTKRRVPAWLLGGVAKGTQLVSVPGLPDPVVLEMANHFWGLSTLWSHDELGYQSRPARQTIADTVAWLRANHPDLIARAAKAA